jgi:seryl-tRNA synthetase
MEDLNRVVVEVQSQKNKMQHEHQEATRKLNDFQQSIQMAGLDKNKIASQLKDLQTTLDDMTRQKHQECGCKSDLTNRFGSTCFSLKLSPMG